MHANAGGDTLKTSHNNEYYLFLLLSNDTLISWRLRKSDIGHD